MPSSSVRSSRLSILPSNLKAREASKKSHGQFCTCNNTCCAISVSAAAAAFAPTVDDEDAAAAVDTTGAAAVDAVESGTVGGIVPIG